MARKKQLISPWKKNINSQKEKCTWEFKEKEINSFKTTMRMFFSFDPGALTWSNQNITTSFISFKHRFPNWHLTHYILGNQNFFLYPPCMVTKITAAIEILSLHICLTISSLRRISHGFIICKLCIQYIHSCKYARK